MTNPSLKLHMLTLFFVLFKALCMGQIFMDKATEYGIFSGPDGSFWGNGVSFYDVNNDGYDDITVLRNNEYLKLYLSDGNGFTYFETSIFCGNETPHAVWVDYNNDGNLDLFLAQFGGINTLYKNLGNFTFTDATIEAGLFNYSALNYGASFGDYNRDGHLDLYICRYYSPDDQTAQTNLLYLNNGNGTFSNVTETTSMGDQFKPSFMGVWIDINDDSWPDMYVINDRFPANSLYKNNGDGTFTDITATAGMGFAFNDPMSATPGDFDNDGDIDIFMSNGGTVSNQPVILAQNNSDETFTQVAPMFGVSTWEITWGALWVDIDNDGWRDLFYCTSELLQNSLYKNLNGLTFEDISVAELGGNIYIKRSYSCAAGDYNNDGYVDIIINNLPPQQPTFMANKGDSNNYIKIRLEGTVSNKQAVGSWIDVYRGAENYHHYTMCGEGFTSQNSQNIIFGLGEDEATLDSVVVRYPSGHKDRYTNLNLGALHHLIEGETYTATIATVGGANGFCAGDSLLLDAGLHHEYLWSNGDTTRFRHTTEGGTQSVTVENEFGIQAFASIEINEYNLPLIAEIFEHPSCYQTATGSIEVSNDAGVPPAQVTWNTGADSTHVDSLPAGNYAYQFIDINGCSTSGSIVLMDPFQLVVLVFVNPESEGNDGSIFVSIFGGTPPYSVYLNGEEGDIQTTGLSGGTYSLSIVDSNDCEANYQVEVGSSLSALEDAARECALIYPNLTTGLCSIKQADQVAWIRLIDLSGKIVLDKQVFGQSNLDLSRLDAGVYMAQIAAISGELFSQKIIKY